MLLQLQMHITYMIHVTLITDKHQVYQLPVSDLPHDQISESSKDNVICHLHHESQAKLIQYEAKKKDLVNEVKNTE